MKGRQNGRKNINGSWGVWSKDKREWEGLRWLNNKAEQKEWWMQEKNNVQRLLNIEKQWNWWVYKVIETEWKDERKWVFIMLLAHCLSLYISACTSETGRTFVS